MSKCYVGLEGCRTLLRGASQYRGKWRRSAPDIFKARVVFVATFEAGHTIRKFSLCLMYTQHVVLHPPNIVARLESGAFRIHRRFLAYHNQRECRLCTFLPPPPAPQPERTASPLSQMVSSVCIIAVEIENRLVAGSQL